jgi:uncharacterized membrane protein YgcG
MTQDKNYSRWRRVKRTYLTVVFFLFFSTFSGLKVSNALAFETIRSFNSELNINQNNSLTIVETLEYDTSVAKHGIFRYLPDIYFKNGLKHQRSITDISVTDQFQTHLPFEISRDGRFLTLKIGDPNLTFSGSKTYILTYTISDAISRWQTQDEEKYHELYWDITGEGWSFPIQATNAVVKSNFAKILAVNCFSGTVNSDDQLCQFSLNKASNIASFSYPNQINYNQNMTILLKLDPNSSLSFESNSSALLKTLHHNFALLTIPIPTLIVFGLWFFKGRNFAFLSSNVYNLDPNQPHRMVWPKLNVREPFVYQPIKELTPGQVGLLHNEKVDTKDIVAEILELARKKYLKISTVANSNKTKWLPQTQDYLLTKLKEADAKLEPVQKYLLSEFFKTKSKVKISEFKGSFYKQMSHAGSILEQSSSNFFTSEPSKAKNFGFSVFISSWLLSIVFVGMEYIKLEVFWPILPILLQYFIGSYLSKNLAQKTAVGYALWLQTRGLKKSIQYGRWREVIKEKHLFIEEVLPYAVALGVVDKLSNDMEKLNLKPPQYLNSGASFGVTDSASNLLTSQALINNLSSSVRGNLKFNPNSSRSGSRSGFSGGSSGGGGGGGGGGSW